MTLARDGEKGEVENKSMTGRGQDMSRKGKQRTRTGKDKGKRCQKRGSREQGQFFFFARDGKKGEVENKDMKRQWQEM